MNASNFLGELKRRNVYRVAVTYAVVSWLLIQIATQVSPYFAVPNWSVRALILLLVVCFPVALTLAWAFELTPEGFKRTEDVPEHKSIRHHTGRKLLALSMVLGVIALAMLLIRSAGLRAYLESSSENAAAMADNAAARPPEKSIAVLPFANLSTNEENGFFADGVQDEILADLARIADLKVISRTSVQMYKSGAARNLREIGRQLGVAHVLEGSVQRYDGHVRVTVQLIDARSDAHIWAQHFDRDLADALAIESEIAQEIATQLKAAFSPKSTAVAEQPTHDIEAFDLYLRAKQLITNFDDSPDRKETLLRALRLLDEAINRDSKFALAYCWAATAHDNLYWFNLDGSSTRLALAKAAAQTALALAPDLGEAHLAQGLVLYHGGRDYKRAVEEVEIARRSLPNSAEVYSLLGWIARRQGRWDDALADLRKAVELDPRNVKVLQGLSSLYDLLRRYDEKLALYDRAIAINPATRDYFQLFRAWTELEKGNLASTHAALAEVPAGYDPQANASVCHILLALFEHQPDVARAVLSTVKVEELAGDGGGVYPPSWYDAMIARAKGDDAAVQRALLTARAKLEMKLQQKPNDAFTLGQIAVVDAGLGRAREAISEATRATELLPLKDDAVDGPNGLTFLALAYTWIGDVNSAIDQLTLLAKIPGGPDYGQLKFSPAWEPLRSDPRFAQMLASIEPPKTH